MLEKSNFGNNWFTNLKITYFILYIIIVSLGMFNLLLPITDFISPFYSVIAVFGVIILVLDLCLKKTLFKSQYCLLLIFFIIDCLISTIYNIKYGVFNNLKTIIWMCIKFFVLCAVDCDLPRYKHQKHIYLISEIFSAIMLIGCILSFGQFITQHSRQIVYGNGYITHEGFYDGRLFGVFMDPNFASLCSLFVIIFAIYNIRKNSFSLIGKIYHFFLITVQSLYVIAANSRTAIICAIIALIFYFGFCLWVRLESMDKSTISKLFYTGIACILSVCILLVCIGGIKKVISYIPLLYSQTSNKNYNKDNQIKNEVVYQDADNDTKSNAIVNTYESKEIGEDGAVDFCRTDVENSNDISNGRFRIWSDYIKVFLSTPIFGTSPRNNLEYAKNHFPGMFIVERQYSVHNTYLSLLVCSGIVGFVIMAIWMVLVVKNVFGYLIRNRHKRDEYYETILMLTLILIIEAVAAFPLMMIFFTNQTGDIIFWITLGYTMGLIRMSEPERYVKWTLPYRVVMSIDEKARKVIKKRKEF